MDRSLDSLAPMFRPMAVELIARLTEAGIPCLIVNTRRSAVEQAALVKAGKSWVTTSRHQAGLAIDLCPYEVFQAAGPDKLAWDGTLPVWDRVRDVVARVGFAGKSYGGNWVQQDLSHCEMPA